MLSHRTRLILLVLILRVSGNLSSSNQSKWTGRNLLNAFSSLHGGCLQGPQQETTQETMLNSPSWWEKNWGRSGSNWPRRGFQDCWKNRDSVCALPNQNHVVCLPGSKKGSTIARGWAMDQTSQACKPGVHCLYACEPGYYWTAFNQGETSNFDFTNAHKKGNCDGTWDYGTSSHGVYCKEDGTLALPSKPLCSMGETFVYAENRLDKHIFLCQTVFPVKPGETVMITTQPMSGWHGPTWNVPPKADIYVSFAGADIMEACTWDEISPSGASLLPYEIGTGVDDNGYMYSSHFFFQQPNSEVPSHMVGYSMDIECESSVEGLCGKRTMMNNLISISTMKKPPPGTTKVKYVFNKPGKDPDMDKVYKEPNKIHLPDPSIITGLKAHAKKSFSSTHYGRKLQTLSESKSYLENTLTEPIVACGTDNGVHLPGMSVGPGEVVQLPEEGTYFIGLKGDSWFACSDMSNLPWVIDINQNSSLGRSGYSYRLNLNPTPDQDFQLTYSMTIKCVSENEECTAVDAQHVSIPITNEEKSSEIFFILGEFTMNNGIKKTSSSSYQWGQYLVHMFSSFLSAKEST